MSYKFIVVPGIWTLPALTQKKERSWKNQLQNYFPGSEYVIFGDFYGPLSFRKISKLLKKVKEEIKNTEKEVVLIGTSYGGLMVHVLLGCLTKELHDKVTLLLTHATPYYLRFFFTGNYRLWFNRSIYDRYVTHITVGSYFDILSPFFLSHHVGSVRANIPNSHLALAKEKVLANTLRLMQDHI